MGAHNGARVARRPVAGRWQFVDVEGLPALLGQLEGSAAATMVGYLIRKKLKK